MVRLTCPTNAPQSNMPACDLEGAPGTMGWHFLTLMPLQSSRLALSSCTGSAPMGPSAAAMEREGGVQQK